MFWDAFKVVLNSLNITVRFDIKDVPFGILDTDNINLLIKPHFSKIPLITLYCKFELNKL